MCTATGPPVVSKNDRSVRSRGGRRPQQRESLLCGVPTRPGAKDAARYERVARSAGAFLAAATVAVWSPCGAMGTARRASTQILDARCHAKKAAGASIGTRGVDVSLGAVARAVLAST